MISICVVDDDKFILDQTKKYLNHLSLFNEIHVDYFSRSEDEKIVNETYNIYILDIDMPAFSGFEVATLLHKKNKNATIIFMSSHEDYVYESFNFHAFYFVRKSIFKKDMDKAFKHLYKVMVRRNRKYLYVKNGKTIPIKYEDILYFDKVKNEMHLYVKNLQTLLERKSVAQLLSEIKSNDFCLINSGVYINFLNVENIMKRIVTMIDGKALEISRRREKEVLEAYMNYLLREGE